MPSWQSQGKTVTKLEGASFFRRFLYSSRRSATSPRDSSLSTIRARERLAVMFFMILPRTSIERESVNSQEQQGKALAKKKTENSLWKGDNSIHSKRHHTHTKKTVWRSFKKLQIELSYNPAIPLLTIYPKKIKTLIRRYMYSNVLGRIIYNCQGIKAT